MREKANAGAAMWGLSQRTERASDRLLLAMLASYADSEDKAWPSQSTLSAASGLDLKTIAVGLKRLEEGKFIQNAGRTPAGTTVWKICRSTENGGAPPKTVEEISTPVNNPIPEGVQGEMFPKPPPPPKPRKDRGTLEEVIAYCKSIDLPESDAHWFFNKCEGNGWKNGGSPIEIWRSTVAAWKHAGYMPSQKNGHAKALDTRSAQQPVTAQRNKSYGSATNGTPRSQPNTQAIPAQNVSTPR